MTQPPIEALLKRSGSIYKLVILAARRAKELAEGAPALVNAPSRKITTVALEEILQGKVLYAPEASAGSTKKKGRGGKTKERKKRT